MKHHNLKCFLYPVILILASCHSNDNSDKLSKQHYQSPAKPPMNLFAKVEYSYSGCFSKGSAQIAIYQGNDVFAARLQSGDSIEQETILTPAQFDSFVLFVDNLKSFSHEGFCTTVAKYKVVIQNDTIEKVDESCTWNGFSKLKNSLFTINK